MACVIFTWIRFESFGYQEKFCLKYMGFGGVYDVSVVAGFLDSRLN